jgi:FixJ family two-component response regulator
LKKKYTIYVIDDDESVRRSFKRLLDSADFFVETFSSPEQFSAWHRKDKSACVISDLRMPGSTGFDLLQKLSSQGTRTPLIIVSASDDEQSRERARDLGAVAFFRKPVDDQALLDAISWAVMRPGTGVR